MVYRTESNARILVSDAIEAHRDLFEKGQILHREMSQNNIIIIITDLRRTNGLHGMLINLDLATTVNENEKNERSEAQKMTGTLKFMAIEIIEFALGGAKLDLCHAYRHDLESFLLLFLSVCIDCGWGVAVPCEL